jgi:hypothetical protein
LASRFPVSAACESASQIAIAIAITIVDVTTNAENTEGVKGVTAGVVKPSPFSATMDP